MDLIQQQYTDYNCDVHDQLQQEESDYISPPTLRHKSAAPNVKEDHLSMALMPKLLDPTRSVVDFNPTFDQLGAPIYGPAHPYAKDGMAQGMRNHKLGFVEDTAIDRLAFDEQLNTFYRYGYTTDPSTNNYVGDLDALHQNCAYSVYNAPHSLKKKRKIENNVNREANSNRLDASNPMWLLKNRESPWSGSKQESQIELELTEEQKIYAEEYAKKKLKERDGKKGNAEVVDIINRITFHGKEERDYQGRSWIAPPKDAKQTNDRCYMPKRLVHTWRGHTKGVSAIRFFPNHGHLILSAGMDSKVKIWDVFNSGNCMRTYAGHANGVGDISFCNDGTKFLSAGFDRNIKYWDTETGQVISTFSTGQIPYVVKLNPDDDKQNLLLAGMKDKKIVQWDVNTGNIVQEYDSHMGAVNTITFVDDNRRFVTSSDDKSLRVWDFGIPVVIKYISEPHMHSMPSITLHPSGNYIAAQSMDNQILVYSPREKFKLEKKRFKGHEVAGYACQVNFSRDGRFVMSGDGEGKCRFWDWKNCKVLTTLICHQGVCIGCEWHPLEQSKVATCGWDGLIKYWD